MNEEDAQMLDIEEAIEGTELYRQFGGGCLVSPTGAEIGRDPSGLRRISLATGVHIVMGAGHYLGAAQDDSSMAAQTVAEIAEEFVREVVHGVTLTQGNKMHRDGGWGVPTGIKAGIIGEIGCSHPLLPGERKTLQAAAIAQRATGVPIQIHPGRDAVSDTSAMERKLPIFSRTNSHRVRPSSARVLNLRPSVVTTDLAD
jgi:phosphotriesterase-related protein